jgi:hypothetical protein
LRRNSGNPGASDKAAVSAPQISPHNLPQIAPQEMPHFFILRRATNEFDA